MKLGYIIILLFIVMTTILNLSEYFYKHSETIFIHSQITANNKSLSNYLNSYQSITYTYANETLNITNNKYLDYDMVILFYSTIYHEFPSQSTWAAWFGDYHCNITVNKTIYLNKKILLTSNKKLLTYSSALIYNAMDIGNETILTNNNNINILYALESPFYSTALKNNKTSSQYNLLMSYHDYADIPIPWRTRHIQYRDFYNYDNADNKPWRILSYEEKTRLRGDTLIVWFGKNCHTQSGRENYLSKLFKLIPSDSYGKCLNTFGGKISYPKWEPKQFINRGGTSMTPKSLYNPQEIVSQYKFLIIIENSNCRSFVTEKVNNAFEVGTIPILFSVNNTPNYNDFIPDNSYINIADFNNITEFANYLKIVANNKTLYEEYFDYKKYTNISEKKLNYYRLMNKYPFNLLANNEFTTQWCRAANVIYNYKLNNYKLNVKPDDTCLPNNLMAEFI